MQGNLSRHKQSVHEGIKCYCSKCDKQFTQKGTLAKHIQSVHIKSVHKKIKYEKLESEQQTLDEGIIKLDMKSGNRLLQPSEGKSLFLECTKCEYRAPNKSELIVHKVTVHKWREFQCGLCCFVTDAVTHLTEHLQQCI